MNRMLAALLVALALLPAALGPATAARANGVPQLVKLTYLDGVSNFGPKDAEGVLEFSFAEGYVHLEVKNLKPAEGYSYEGWLTSPTEALFVGKIEPSAAGASTVEWELGKLPTYDYNTFVVIARKGEAAGTLPAAKSIAGRFTVISDSTATGSGSVADTRPGTLPETGQAAPGLDWARIFWTMAAMGGVALSITVVRRHLAKGARA